MPSLSPLSSLVITEYKRVLIQPGERRRSTGHKINSQIECTVIRKIQYKPLWKCSKRFIPPQTDGMIRFYSNIGCSESKVIFKWRKNNNNKDKNKAFTRSKSSHLVYFIQSQSELCQLSQQTQPIRDAHKLAQNVFPPWNPTLTS